jgi:hypothetical protein
MSERCTALNRVAIVHNRLEPVLNRPFMRNSSAAAAQGVAAAIFA